MRRDSEVKEPPLIARMLQPICEARQSGVEGEVIHDAVVDTSGKPTILKWSRGRRCSSRRARVSSQVAVPARLSWRPSGADGDEDCRSVPLG